MKIFKQNISLHFSERLKVIKLFNEFCDNSNFNLSKKSPFTMLVFLNTLNVLNNKKLRKILKEVKL